MARTQFTFTFTNAQPGSVVSFGDGVLDHLYADATSSTRVGRPLVLDSSNALSVWSDVETLTATTEDGVGNDISATATRANPSVTTDAGTAGQNPYGGSVAVSELRLALATDPTPLGSGSDDYPAFAVVSTVGAGLSLGVDGNTVTAETDGLLHATMVIDALGGGTGGTEVQAWIDYGAEELISETLYVASGATAGFTRSASRVVASGDTLLPNFRAFGTTPHIGGAHLTFVLIPTV